MKLLSLKRQLLVPVLLVIGALAAVARELVIANRLGDSLEADVFRVAYSLPNYMTQTLGTLLTTVVVGLLIKTSSWEAKVYIFYKVSAVVVVVSLIGMATVEWQLQLLYPGFEADDSLLRQMAICWLMFMIAGLTLFPRADLNLQGYRWPAASSQLFRAAVFILSFLIIDFFGVDIVDALIWSAVISSIPLLATHWRGIKKWLKLASKGFERVYAPVLAAMGLAGLLQLVSSAPRFIDRYFASEFLPGAIAIVEYSYGISLLAVGLAVNTLAIVIIPKISKDGFSFFSRRKALGLAVLAFSVVLCIFIFIFMSHADKLVDIFFFMIEISDESKAGMSRILQAQLSVAPVVVLSGFLCHFYVAQNKYIFPVAAAAIKVIAKVSFFIMVPVLGYDVFANSYILAEVAFFIILALGVVKYSKEKQC